MNEMERKYFNILVVGKGKEYLQPLEKEVFETFTENDLYFGVSEGFAAAEITDVIISIGADVVAGLSTYYIVKLIDKIYQIKSKAEKEGQRFNIQINVKFNSNFYIGSDCNEIKQVIEKIKKQSVGDE